MNVNVNSYLEFINESNLEFLLEARIQLMPKLISLLDKIESPISKSLIKLQDKDVDVNINYVDISDKNDCITFIPDDRVKTNKYKVKPDIRDSVYMGLSQTARDNKTYPIDNVSYPTEGTIGEIVNVLTLDELNKIMKSDNWSDWKESDRLVHFRWTLDNTIKNVLIKNSGLIRYIDDYKTNDFKVGKFVNKILSKVGYNFTNVEIEDFVNKYKTQMKLRNNTLNRFEIVSGEDIRKYYLVDNYFQIKGTLGTSCMRGKGCQPYFDIYVNNPDKVSMVILKQESGYVEDYVDEQTGEILQIPIEDKITGRALLWIDNKGRKIMDRIYVNDSSDTEFFKEYANINGYYYKKEQDFNEGTLFVYKGFVLSSENSIVTIDLKKGIDYPYYPYMDTMKFYSIKNGTLTNHDKGTHDFYLEDTDGGVSSCEVCHGSEEIECYQCDGTGEIDCPECDTVGKDVCDFCDGEKKVHCPECDGEDPNCAFCKGKEIICPECDGIGQVDCFKCLGVGEVTCPNCDGEIDIPCPECRPRT